MENITWNSQSFDRGIAMISSDHHMVIVINFSSLEKPEKNPVAQYSHLQDMIVMISLYP